MSISGSYLPKSKTYFSLIIHAHVPFIRQFELLESPLTENLIREMTDTYIPLLYSLEKMASTDIPFRLTFAVSPVFLSMIRLPDVQAQCIAHMRHQQHQYARMKDNSADQSTSARSSEWFENRYRQLADWYEGINRNLIGVLKNLQARHVIEIMAGTASHGYLPLMKTEEAVKAQIAAAVQDYNRHFGVNPRGIWLPECGYTIGIDRVLKPYGIDYFIVEPIAVREANPRPNRGTFAPLMTPYGVTAFAFDHESAELINRPDNGYPNDTDYLDLSKTRHGANMLRITDHLPHAVKELYQPETAMNKTRAHALHFWQQLLNRTGAALHHMDRKPHIVTIFEASQFGSGWFEGAPFVEQLCRQFLQLPLEIGMITPSGYLDEYPVADVGRLKESSRGRGWSSETWLHPGNDWMYIHLHQAELRMVKLATFHSAHGNDDPLTVRLLNQAGRELMLSQSADWPSMLDRNWHPEYAASRFKDHLGCMNRLCAMLESGEVDAEFVQALEYADDCLPDFHFRDYAQVFETSPIPIIIDEYEYEDLIRETRDKPNVFMLSWEYPPKTIGGLAVAVCELSEALVRQGQIVHVITSAYGDAPHFEQLNGVYVHRLPVTWSYETELIHWQFEMNLAIIDHLICWKENGGRIDLIHAHDWMVYTAAREMKHTYAIPMVATIHATEWGRNQGSLSSELQRKINSIEWHLTYEAAKVFVCSEYMRNEVIHVFNLPGDKIEVVHNGVPLIINAVHDLERTRRRFAPNGEKIIFYVGRLVYEKGVQSLIEAFPAITQLVDNVKLIIAGTGSMEYELRARAAHLKDRIQFYGYVNDQMKNELFQIADVCVIPSFYEPFGIVALETMRYRRPLVISDTGGMKELVEHGVDGYKALPGNIQSFTEQICDLLIHPEKGQKMAERAYEKLKKQYNWERIAHQMIQEYKRLLKSS